MAVSLMIIMSSKSKDALREGLLLRYQFPHDDIKVCEITEEVMQGTALH